MEQINEQVKSILKRQGIPNTMLSDATRINYKSLYDKLTFDRLKAYDLLKVAKVLNIDLNKMRDEVEI